MSRFSRENLSGNIPKVKKVKRDHINFKLEFSKKSELKIFIDFLKKDIHKRLIIDKKFRNHSNNCHLKHLNFIIMEILLNKILTKFYNDFDNKTLSDDEKNKIKDEILYLPTDPYEKDLTQIDKLAINKKYEMMNNNKRINEITDEIYEKYKGFDFINVNFLKRKIYEYI